MSDDTDSDPIEQLIREVKRIRAVSPPPYRMSGAAAEWLRALIDEVLARVAGDDMPALTVSVEGRAVVVRWPDVIRPEWKAEVDRIFAAWAIDSTQNLTVPPLEGSAEAAYLADRLRACHDSGGISKAMFVGVTGLPLPE